MADRQAYGTHFATEEIGGQEVELYVTTKGIFNSVFNDEYAEATSKEELIVKLKRTIKRKKYSIPMYRMLNGRLIGGIITGKHSGNHNYLVTWEDGEKSQVSSWGITFIQLNPDEKAALIALNEAAQKATAEANAYIKAHAFNPSDLLKGD